MSGIVMALVDDHYVHGQVGMRWCNATETDLMIVVSDDLAKDKTRQGLLDMAVLDGIHSRYYTLDKAINKLPSLETEGKEAMVICGSIDDLVTLIDSGVDIPKVVISSIKNHPGRRQFHPSVALNSEELVELVNLENRGIDVVLRRVPDEDKVELEDIRMGYSKQM